MSEEKTEFRPRDRWLMFALWGGPMAALTNLTVNYSLVPEACDRGTKTMLHLITLAFVLVTLGCALIARHYYKQCEGGEGVLWMERTRWFALVAMILSLSSAVVIVAMEVPNVLLGSCA